METRLSGSAFQILAAANGKARLPTVESLKGCVLPLFDSTLIKKFKLAQDNCVKLSHRAALITVVLRVYRRVRQLSRDIDSREQTR